MAILSAIRTSGFEAWCQFYKTFFIHHRRPSKDHRAKRQISAILEYLTFTIGKYKSSKFLNCPSETEILQSYFEIANSKSKSQQRTLQMNKIELVDFHKRL
jgi:hypothetical protein